MASSPPSQTKHLNASPDMDRLCKPNKRNLYPGIRPYRENVTIGEKHGYFNGSICHGPSGKKYILMSMPTSCTIDAIWEVMIREEIGHIYTLETLSENVWEKHEEWKVLERKPGPPGLHIVIHQHKETGQQIKRYVVREWIDHKQPPKCIFKLLGSKHLKKSIPVAIHCKAGCGRAGTLACAMELYFNPSLSVHELVDKMRKQRMYLVSTQNQLDFLLAFQKLLLLNTC